MRGLKIEKALPSDGLDIWKLLIQARDEGIFPDPPTDQQLRDFNVLKFIHGESISPYHIWLVAKRGRGILGCLHAIITPRRWDNEPPDEMFIELVYVTESRRKRGIGKKLIDELVKNAENMGIKKIDLLSVDKIFDDYWVKKRKAEKVSNFGRIEL